MSGLRMLHTVQPSTPAISSYRSPSSGIFYSCVTASNNSESLSVVMPNRPYRLYRGRYPAAVLPPASGSRTTRPRNVLTVWDFLQEQCSLIRIPSIRIKSSSSGTRCP